MKIRKAKVADVPQIHTLLDEEAKGGRVLPRSLSELYDSLRDYFVAENDKGELLGVCALHVAWETLAELRSLVVEKNNRRRGIGTSLVHACFGEAPLLGIRKLFVLTYEVGFFKRFGFSLVPKESLPHKIWSDCIRCCKFPNCDEEAMVLEL